MSDTLMTRRAVIALAGAVPAIGIPEALQASNRSAEARTGEALIATNGVDVCRRLLARNIGRLADSEGAGIETFAELHAADFRAGRTIEAHRLLLSHIESAYYLRAAVAEGISL